MSDNVVKVGLKNRHIRIPTGWKLVKTGTVFQDDKFLCLATYCWEYMDSLDIGESVENYDYVIRKESETRK